MTTNDHLELRPGPIDRLNQIEIDKGNASERVVIGISMFRGWIFWAKLTYFDVTVGADKGKVFKSIESGAEKIDAGGHGADELLDRLTRVNTGATIDVVLHMSKGGEAANKLRVYFYVNFPSVKISTFSLVFATNDKIRFASGKAEMAHAFHRWSRGIAITDNHLTINKAGQWDLVDTPYTASMLVAFSHVQDLIKSGD